MARTRLYRDGKLELEGFPPADISEYLPDESVTIWLDLLDPDGGVVEAVQSLDDSRMGRRPAG